MGYGVVWHVVLCCGVVFYGAIWYYGIAQYGIQISFHDKMRYLFVTAYNLDWTRRFLIPFFFFFSFSYLDCFHVYAPCCTVIR